MAIDSRLVRAIRNNQSTAGDWEPFSQHRTQVSNLLINLCRDARETHLRPTELCVLGAGNCNDLDLARLTKEAAVCLVDFDTSALQDGIQRQVPPNGSVEISASDLTDPAAHQVLLRRRFDIVASVGVLSQLISDVLTDGNNDDEPKQIISAVRSQHIGLMAALLRDSAARAVLLNDLVSSLTAPELAGAAEGDLPIIMDQLISRGNFFTGNNPYAILEQIDTDPRLVSVQTVQRTAPWIWQVGGLWRLVYGIVFRADLQR